MKDINQYRYITHKNQNTMIRVIIENPKTGKSYICKSYGKTVGTDIQADTKDKINRRL